jgi:heme-degrading monooxygenase HmoA
MNARLSRWAGLPPEMLDQTVRQFEEDHLPEIERQPGYQGALVMLDRASGRAAAVTFWESDADMRASDRLAEQARAAAEETLGPVREPIVDHYEVVLRK